MLQGPTTHSQVFFFFFQHLWNHKTIHASSQGRKYDSCFFTLWEKNKACFGNIMKTHTLVSSGLSFMVTDSETPFFGDVVPSRIEKEGNRKPLFLWNHCFRTTMEDFVPNNSREHGFCGIFCFHGLGFYFFFFSLCKTRHPPEIPARLLRFLDIYPSVPVKSIGVIPVLGGTTCPNVEDSIHRVAWRDENQLQHISTYNPRH